MRQRDERRFDGDVNTKRSRDRDDEFSRSRPAKKLLSAVGAVKNSNEIDTEGSKQTVAELQNAPSVVNRNRRMLGALMGHLGMAKKRLEQDSSKIELQANLKIAATQKNIVESQRLLEIQKDIDRAEKEKEVRIREQIQIERRQEDIPKWTASWKAKIPQVQNFLMTKASPPLPWLPVRHNEFSLALLATRKEEIANQIREREMKDENELNALQEKLVEVTERLKALEEICDKRPTSEPAAAVSPREVDFGIRRNVDSFRKPMVRSEIVVKSRSDHDPDASQRRDRRSPERRRGSADEDGVVNERN